MVLPIQYQTSVANPVENYLGRFKNLMKICKIKDLIGKLVNSLSIEKNSNRTMLLRPPSRRKQLKKPAKWHFKRS